MESELLEVSPRQMSLSDDSPLSRFVFGATLSFELTLCPLQSVCLFSGQTLQPLASKPCYVPFGCSYAHLKTTASRHLGGTPSSEELVLARAQEETLVEIGDVDIPNMFEQKLFVFSSKMWKAGCVIEDANSSINDRMEAVLRTEMQYVQRLSLQENRDAQVIRKRLAERAWLFGLCENISINVKGNCQFDAAADQLNRRNFLGQTMASVRKRAVKWIKDHENNDLGNGTTIRKWIEAIPEHKSFKDYLKTMSSKGSWGDEVTLLAIREDYGVCIVLLSSTEGSHNWYQTLYPYGKGPADTLPQLWLGHEFERHYWSLIDIQRPHQQIQQPLPALQQHHIIFECVRKPKVDQVGEEAKGASQKRPGNVLPCYELEDGIGWVSTIREHMVLRVRIPVGFKQFVCMSTFDDPCNLKLDIQTLKERHIFADGETYFDLIGGDWKRWSDKGKKFAVFQLQAHNDADELACSPLFFIYNCKMTDQLKRQGYCALAMLSKELVPPMAHEYLTISKLYIYWREGAANQAIDAESEKWKKDMCTIKRTLPSLGNYADVEGWWVRGGKGEAQKHLNHRLRDGLIALPYFHAERNRIFWVCYTQGEDILGKLRNEVQTQSGNADSDKIRMNNVKILHNEIVFEVTTNAMERYLASGGKRPIDISEHKIQNYGPPESSTPQ